MRVSFLTALLAVGANGLNIPRQVVSGSAGPAPTNSIVVFNKPKWPLLDPEQALTALYEKAKATPAAVSIVSNVPIPPDVSSVLSKHKAAQATSAPTSSKHGAASEAEDVSKASSKGLVAVEATAATCTNPQTHVEWRGLTDAHKQQYVAAMKCLFNKPARSGLPGVKNRWDDLVAIHQHMSDTIHNVGQFLPWHRYMLKMLEMEMRGTCGYSGPMTWWDETKDAGNFNGAPMMTEQYFGHMPRGNTVCIISGVFKNTQCHIGPGTSNVNHCLSRGVTESTSAVITSSFVNTCLSHNDYSEMQNCLFFGPHGYGHNAIGGDMSDVNASPNDPAFYLHHAFINRHWRIWQRTNPNARTYAIGGNTRQNCGNNCQTTTLDYELTSYGFYPSVKVRDVMDTLGSYLCYKYDY